MTVEVENLGIRFRREWIFRKFSYTFRSPSTCAVTGENGSGKSTLLRAMAGHLSPLEGKISYRDLDGKEIHKEDVFRYISFSGPYMELIEELTLDEMIRFHGRFKNWKKGVDHQEVLRISGLERHSDKYVRFFSSGMKQRLKLALAMLSDTALVFLDEPTTNLDAEGVRWYRDLIREFGNGRLLLIASNLDREYDFCEEEVNIHQFK